MVLIESEKKVEPNAPAQEEMTESENCEAKAATQKLFSCEEIERTTIGSQLTDTIRKSTEELKQVDPAVMSCSSKTKLTRYSKEELHKLKEGQHAKAMPECLTRPEIMNLKLLRGTVDDRYFNNVTGKYQSQPFDLGSGWNPQLAQFIMDYHRIMSQASQLNLYGNPLQGLNQQRQQHMPFLDQQQAAFLDKISPYDRNNFYDNITNNMRQPCPRMGVTSLGNSSNGGNGYQQNRNFNNNNNAQYMRKPNPGPNDRYNGNIPVNGMYKNPSADGHPMEKKKGEGNEKEPEWYTAEASLDDIVDLHGFEEGDIENQPQPKVAPEKTEKGYGTPSLAYRRSGYNQNRNMRPNDQPRPIYNQRFRNPIHYQPSQQFPQMNHNNPYFDAWKRSNLVWGESTSFSRMMSDNPPPVSQIPKYPDAETALRATNFLSSLMSKNQMPLMPQQPGMPMNQFFNNWSNQGGQFMPNNGGGNGMNMPTQEQLQMHTTEIMRNAILRRNQQQQQQQYNDERGQYHK